MVEFKDRLEEAMRLSGVDIHALAEALGVSYQAVKKVVEGRSAAMSARNNSLAAKLMRVNPDWLATGEGQPNYKAAGAAQSEATATVAVNPPAEAVSWVVQLAEFMVRLSPLQRALAATAVRHLLEHPEDAVEVEAQIEQREAAMNQAPASERLGSRQREEEFHRRIEADYRRRVEQDPDGFTGNTRPSPLDEPAQPAPPPAAPAPRRGLSPTRYKVIDFLGPGPGVSSEDQKKGGK